MKISVAAVAILFAASPALADGQLPDGAAPSAYDITIRPDARAMTFHGEETVVVEVARPTRTLTLNAADLKIGRAVLDGVAVPVRLDVPHQQLVLTAPRAIAVGRHRLDLAWDGTIGRSAAGFFAIDYTNKDGSAARMLATQFEAADARRFAPVWDEPAFKATFTLTAIAPAGQTAFSNMPTDRIEKQEDGSRAFHFAVTPKMSSYLLFLGIGDVERKTVMAGKTEIGVITRRGVVDQGDYALAQAKRLLAYYNDYFGQPYPLPKLDMVAAPGSSQFFGAMENWGAIFYFEPELLYDEKRASQSGKQRIFTVVAHEMAHQWFGDLVTMRWWDDLWLNEGFASWMENKTAIDLNPDWNAAAAAVAKDRESALNLDSTIGTHPIVRHVETVDQIGAAFDDITYEKGQQVIGMLEATLGPDVFRDGIRRYMAQYRYGNTRTDQLWTELSAAAGRPVAEIAHDFTLQPGVPLVRLGGARCVGGVTQVRLAQRRFGYDAAANKPLTWRVPLALGVVGQASVRAIVRGTNTTVAVPGCGTLVLNAGKASYARSLYDEAGHAGLVRGFGTLALADQLGTLGDDLALAKGGYQPLGRWFADIAGVGSDAHPLLWQTTAAQLSDLEDRVPRGPKRDAVRNRVAATLGPVLQRVGYDAARDEAPSVATLRETLIGALGEAGDPGVAARARASFAALEHDPEAIPPAIRSAILGVFALNATPDEWERLLKLTRAETNPVTRNSYVRLLGAARDDALADRALALVLMPDFTTPQKAALLSAVAQEHPDRAFDFAVAHLAAVNALIETSSRAVAIANLGAGSDDPAMPRKIAAYARANLPPGSRGPAQAIVLTMAARRQVTARIAGDVAAWGRAAN